MSGGTGRKGRFSREISMDLRGVVGGRGDRGGWTRVGKRVGKGGGKGHREKEKESGKEEKGTRMTGTGDKAAWSGVERHDIGGRDWGVGRIDQLRRRPHAVVAWCQCDYEGAAAVSLWVLRGVHVGVVSFVRLWCWQRRA